ncbi:MAG: restriction endonuclease subunit S [Acidobacteriota bacterium]|nr:restriction endonuclease subunit S [Acidobacteriota bacterium]
MILGRYQTYLEQKNSEISWLGNIPTDWKLKRFKNLFRIQKRIAGEVGHDILSITQRGVKIKDISSGDGQLSMDYSKYQLVHCGEYAMNHMDLLTGYVDISRYNGVTSPDYRVFTLKDKGSHDRYYLYLLQLCYISKIFYPLGQGAAQLGRWRLPAEAFNNFVAPSPSKEEQTQIANFLDHETAKIDTLIEKQQELIELLKEKRQAVISHAVTKGLNPDAPMKPSGVEWLGDVPAHWEVTRLKHECSDIVDCLHSTPEYSSFGVFPAIRTADITPGKLDIENARRVDENVYKNRNIRLTPQADDIIYSREGERFGIAALVPKEAMVCLGQRVMLFRATKTPKYLMWSLNSDPTYRQAQQDVIGSTSPHVNVDTIKNFYLAWPPENEREIISFHIDRSIESFDKIESIASTKIDLLQERRAALISAAVTGKIDVRNWQPPEPTQEEPA